MSQLVPPTDIEAERAAVSACLLSPEALAVARDILRPEHLYDPVCRLVLESAYEVDDTGARIDAVTIATRMRDSERFAKIGGPQKLAELFDATPDPTHIEEHASIVVDKCRLRRVIDVCRMHAAEAHGDVGNVGEYCSRVERDVLGATDAGSTVDSPKTIAELVKEIQPEVTQRQDPTSTRSRTRCTTTGIYELDYLLGGGYDPQFYIGAGRPGQGKSAFSQSNAIAVADKGKSVVIVSLEMPKAQIAMRLLSMVSLVPYKSLKSERLTPEHWDSFLAATEYLSKLPISIQSLGGAHVSQVRSVFRREFARHKRSGIDPGLGVIDYLQLVSGNRTSKSSTREEEVASVSRACMAMPSEFGCPILGLSQLNRNVESRPDKRPQLHDLRESGSLEQDGYGIMAFYRDEYYHPETEAKGIAEIIVLKNRNGESGTVECKFDGPCMRFASMQERLYDDLDDINQGITG